MASMTNPVYKKVDISLLNRGLTLPLSSVKDFEAGKHVKKGTYREVKIIWGKKTYKAQLWNKRQTNRKRGHVHQLSWAGDKGLLKRLRKTFVHTYIATSTQKEEALKIGKKKTRTKLIGAQEILILTPTKKGDVELDVFYRVKDQWTPFFENLVENNVFPWLMWGEKEKEYLYQRSTQWYEKRDLKNHLNAEMIIYYLADTHKKEIYVGKANRLEKRVKPGRKEIPEWNKFRYDIVRPQYAHLLSRIEENTIRTFASILENSQGLSSLEIGKYTLKNRNIPRLD